MVSAVAKQPAPRATAPTSGHSSSGENRDDATFLEHLHELRARFFWVGVVFMAASAAAYYFKDPLVNFIMAPLGGEKLIYLSVGGGFNFIFQITMLAGLFAAAPMIILQLYKFVSPALPVSARRSSALIVFCSMVLLLAGAAFGYYVAVPAAINFLAHFADAHVTSTLTAESYLSFVLTYLIGLGLVFQLPILLVFWHWINPMNPKKLFASQRFLIVFAFIAAAIITPTPDVVNQLIIAGPVIGVYQLGVISVLTMHYRDRSKQRRQPARAVAITSSPQLVKAAIHEHLHSIDDALRQVALTQIPPPRRHSHQAAPSVRRSSPAPQHYGNRSVAPARNQFAQSPRRSMGRQVSATSQRLAVPSRRLAIDGFARRAVS